MNNIKRVGIFIIIFILMLSVCIGSVYAETSSSDKQALRDMLDQYKGELGDLKELKVVADKIHSELHSATKVDDTLKGNLRDDVEMLDNVSGMNSLVLTVLKSELNSQIDELTDSNLSEMIEEIDIIKEWIDEQVPDSNNPNNNTSQNTTPIDNKTNQQPQNTATKNQPKANTSANSIQVDSNKSKSLNILPKTGLGRTIFGLAIIAITSTIVSIIKYKKYKDII